MGYTLRQQFGAQVLDAGSATYYLVSHTGDVPVLQLPHL